MNPILNWLALITIVASLQLVVQTGTIIVVFVLFTKHDQSVLRKLDALFGQGALQSGNATSTLDVARGLRNRLDKFLGK